MPTPRDQAKKTGSKLSGEPKAYCGACGLPSSDCKCSSYSESGSKQTATSSPKKDGASGSKGY